MKKLIMIIVLIAITIPCSGNFVIESLASQTDPLIPGDSWGTGVTMVVNHLLFDPLQNPVSVSFWIELNGINIYWPNYSLDYHEEVIHISQIWHTEQRYMFQLFGAIEWPMGMGDGSFKVICNVKDRTGRVITSAEETYFYEE